ncbi:MAG: alanine/glycine:cation symporter family protein [Pseudomonadales bacterium]
MESLNRWLVATSDFVWTNGVIGLCVVAGLYCTLRLGFVQFRSLPHAMQLLRGKYSEGCSSNDISTLQALATTLASTTGIGNIAGVAIAIKIGGPGAIFWMWMMALLGMALKFVEATLGSLYRRPAPDATDGAMVGGPMYYLADGLGPRWRPVAYLYAGLATVTFLGAWNMFQANQASAIIYDQFSVPTWATSIALTFFSGLVLIGGIHRIGQVASRIVPTMCLIYLAGVAVILAMNFDQVPAAFQLIFSEAFNTDASLGGAMGIAVLWGIRRAMFSNEAGVGSAAIAFAAAHSKFPVRQGIIASLGPFIDTVVVCTATALVILIGGFYGSESHQPVNKLPLSFEVTESNQLFSQGWNTTSAYPSQHGSLQSLLEGEQALQYSGDDKALQLPLAPLLSEGQLLEEDAESTIDGLRFSVYLKDTLLTAELINAKGETVATEPVSSLQNGRWQSFVLPLPPQRDNLQGWSLKLSPQAGNEGELYIDRVQWVADVTGILLSTAAFSHFLGSFGTFFVPIAALLFAYTSIIAGSYYGEVSCQYLHPGLFKPYLWLYVVSIFVGGIVNLEIVINFSDLFLGLACIPNLIAMMLLTPRVAKEYKKYFAELEESAEAENA